MTKALTEDQPKHDSDQTSQGADKDDKKVSTKKYVFPLVLALISFLLVLGIILAPGEEERIVAEQAAEEKEELIPKHVATCIDVGGEGLIKIHNEWRDPTCTTTHPHLTTWKILGNTPIKVEFTTDDGKKLIVTDQPKSYVKYVELIRKKFGENAKIKRVRFRSSGLSTLWVKITLRT